MCEATEEMILNDRESILSLLVKQCLNNTFVKKIKIDICQLLINDHKDLIYHAYVARRFFIFDREI